MHFKCGTDALKYITLMFAAYKPNHMLIALEIVYRMKTWSDACYSEIIYAFSQSLMLMVKRKKMIRVEPLVPLSIKGIDNGMTEWMDEWIEE